MKPSSAGFDLSRFINCLYKKSLYNKVKIVTFKETKTQTSNGKHRKGFVVLSERKQFSIP